MILSIRRPHAMILPPNVASVFEVSIECRPGEIVATEHIPRHVMEESVRSLAPYCAVLEIDGQKILVAPEGER